MHAEDYVLVGVINTRRDFLFAQNEHWYRIPQHTHPLGIYADYLAFFLSGAAFQSKRGTIAYYARRLGVELVRRRDLIPSQPEHDRADQIYYRLALGSLIEKSPPILNQHRRSISFIHTTGAAFMTACDVVELYGQNKNL